MLLKASSSPIASRLVPWAYRVGARVAVLDISQVLWGRLRDLPRRTARADITFRPLDKRELEQWSRDSRYELDQAMCDRAESGLDRCFGAFDGERLASYIWLATGSIEAEYNFSREPRTGIPLSFPQSMVYGYKALTVPEYRGHGILPALVANLAPTLKREGFEEFFVLVEWTNHNSVRAFQKVGLVPLGTIAKFGIPQLVWTRSSERISEHRIRVGDQAQVVRRSPKAAGQK